MPSSMCRECGNVCAKRRMSFLSSHPRSPTNCGTSTTRTARHGHSLPSYVRSRKSGEEKSTLTGAIMTEHVKTEIAAGIMTLTLARPDKKNALSNAMYSAMSDGLERAEKDPAVRVVLFQGDGDNFTAGNDLADFSAQANGKDTSESQAHRFIGNLGKATRPRLAAVQGNAVGVGTTMLLHCDLVFLAENARLMTPFVNLALVPEAASSWLLPARIGHVRAYAMFALGEPVDAATALARGLANAVVPVGELRGRAPAAAEDLTKRTAGSLWQSKDLKRDTEKIAAQNSRESGLFAERLSTTEFREAFAAVAERSKPDFSKLPA